MPAICFLLQLPRPKPTIHVTSKYGTCKLWKLVHKLEQVDKKQIAKEESSAIAQGNKLKGRVLHQTIIFRENAVYNHMKRRCTNEA
jgi:hypothetical protein